MFYACVTPFVFGYALSFPPPEMDFNAFGDHTFPSSFYTNSFYKYFQTILIKKIIIKEHIESTSDLNWGKKIMLYIYTDRD